MTIERYKADGATFWRVDTEVRDRQGKKVRHRQRRIPSREQAEALEAKLQHESFGGRFLDRRRDQGPTVEQCLQMWAPTSRQKNDSWQTDVGRSKHLVRHLGDRQAASLTLEDVPKYRDLRLKETTKRGQKPMPATLNREVALLRRALQFAVECGDLDRNPVRGAAMLKENNVRHNLVSEVEFARLLECADEEFRAILQVAYDTGMRLDEVLQLLREWLDLKNRRLVLPAEFTKGEKARLILLTGRAVEVLKALPTHLDSPYVFVNPHTGTRWKNTQRMWDRAAEAAGLEKAWFHDLRRSFVTNARRRGVPERVAMLMSGHKTRSIFDRYNIVEEADLAEAADRMEKGAEEELRTAGSEVEPSAHETKSS